MPISTRQFIFTNVFKNKRYRKNVPSSKQSLHRVFQEERLIFREVTVLDIVKKKVYINLCLILNGYLDRAVRISIPNSLRFFFVGLDEEWSLKRNLGTWKELPARILNAAARIKKGEDQIRRRTRYLRTRVAKCIGVAGGIYFELLTNLSFLCNKFVI